METIAKLGPHFWIGGVVYFATLVSAGTITLTNLIPADWIPYAIAWTRVVALVGNGYVLGALGYAKLSNGGGIEQGNAQGAQGQH
jgi:hypothetical protein